MNEFVNEVADDPVRESLRAMWTSVTPSWNDHAAAVDARGSAVTQAMLDAAGLGQGHQVLELACGPGGVGLSAAEIVGPGGAVVLTDFAAEMTAVADRRAQDLGLTNVTTRVADLEDIGYPDESFDAVLCRDGLMLVLDPARATRGVRRVLRPGGRAVFAVWGPRDRNPWLGVLFDAVTAHLGMPVPPPGVPGPFSLEAAGALEALMTGGGFDDVTVAEVPAPMHAASFDEWWSLVPSLAGPLEQLLASLPAESASAIRSNAESALAAFATASGYDLPGVSLVGVGRR